MVRKHVPFIALFTLLQSTLMVSYGQSVELINDRANYSTDSVEAIPFLLSEYNNTSGAQRFLSVTSAEKELSFAKAQKSLEAEVRALNKISDSYIAVGQSKNALKQLRRLLKLKDLSTDENAVSHLYYNLAVVLARMKNYPAALSCFYKAGNTEARHLFKMRRKRFLYLDSSYYLFQANTEETETTDHLVFNDSLIDGALSGLEQVADSLQQNNAVAEPISAGSLIDAFMDQKRAASYAVAIHVKQPAAGKKNVFAGLGNVGHMFITLIKFNKDRSSVTRTFGFYPEKGLLIPVNPIFPNSPAVLKNDQQRSWDEMVGRFVSQRDFTRILEFIDKNSNTSYHLNRFNCSDFALAIGGLANIRIAETTGKWPLGKGNNPGSTGQSILAGRFLNMETNSKTGLFACTNNLFAIGK
ncbi:MAG TPA: tetratricopeptide repeat protein [Sediminibacterium sp.]|nr:tetratricopeptide repeat protein [Sediminibacterium sp.]